MRVAASSVSSNSILLSVRCDRFSTMAYDKRRRNDRCGAARPGGALSEASSASPSRDFTEASLLGVSACSPREASSFSCAMFEVSPDSTGATRGDFGDVGVSSTTD